MGALYLGWCASCRELVKCDAPDTERGRCPYCLCDTVYGPAVAQEHAEEAEELSHGN